MASQSLIEHYRQLRDPISNIFVVPLIRSSHPATDYLYNLYADILEKSSTNSNMPAVQSLSVYAHYRFVWKQLTGTPNVLHYHWFEFQDMKAAAGMIWKFLCILLFKVFGGKLVWTIHNKTPHPKRWLQANFILRKWMAKKADKIHVHCHSVIPELSTYFNIPESKFFVYSHPTFPSVNISSEKSLKRINDYYNVELSKEDSTFLCFGNIARYKQIEQIIPVFTGVQNKGNLVISGPVKKGNQEYYHTLARASEAYDNITIINQFIPDDHVSWFFNGCDYVVINHRDIITSGVFEIAKSYEKEIIAPSMGCLREYSSQEKIHLFHNRNDMEEILLRLINR